jgi:GTP-binding protein HflX
VHAVLGELGAQDRPVVTALNKIDLLERIEVAERWARRVPNAAPISAQNGAGLEELLELVEEQFAAELMVATYRVPQRESRWIARLHEEGHVLDTQYEDNNALVTVELRRARAPAYERFLVETNT